jgi:hypothetical protein
MPDPNFDFTGQNIEDTYQRVVQTDGTNFFDGTGSAVTVGGSQTLQQVTDRGSITTTPITASIISASSVNAFINVDGENTSANTHQLTFFNQDEFGLNGGNPIRLKSDLDPSAGQRLTYIPSTNQLNAHRIVNSELTASFITCSGGIFANRIVVQGTNVLEHNNILNDSFIGSSTSNRTVVRSNSLEATGSITASNISSSGDVIGDTGTFNSVDGFINSDGNNKILTSNGNGTLTAESSLTINNGVLVAELSSFDARSNTGFKFSDSLVNFGPANGIEVTIDSPNGHITASGNISASGELIGIIDGGTF